MGHVCVTGAAHRSWEPPHNLQLSVGRLLEAERSVSNFKLSGLRCDQPSHPDALRPHNSRQVSSLGDAKSSLGDANSSLGDANSSLGDANSSLHTQGVAHVEAAGARRGQDAAAEARRMQARLEVGWKEPRCSTPHAILRSLWKPCCQSLFNSKEPSCLCRGRSGSCASGNSTRRRRPCSCRTSPVRTQKRLQEPILRTPLDLLSKRRLFHPTPTLNAPPLSSPCCVGGVGWGGGAISHAARGAPRGWVRVRRHGLRVGGARAARGQTRARGLLAAAA